MSAAIAWGNVFTEAGATITTNLAGSNVTAEAFDSARPAANAWDPDPSKVARINYVRNSTAGGYSRVSIILGSTLAASRSVRVLSFLNCRIPADATQIDFIAQDYLGVPVGGTASIIASDLVPKSGTTDRYDLSVVLTAATTIANVNAFLYLPVSSAGYWEIGHVWASPALVLSQTDAKWSHAPIDGSEVARSPGGALLADVNGVRNVFRAGLSRLTQAEAFGVAASTAPSIRRLQGDAGRHDPVLVIGRTSSAFWLQVQSVYGALRQVPTLRENETLFDTEIEVEEIV